MNTDINTTFNAFNANTSHENILLNNSYAPTSLNQSNLGIRIPKTFIKMGKAAPISSVQMAKDIYRKG